eukprot:m.453937 g.453937  ORF g.453937 m.453937 type:complete len:77 (+) comp20577_c0_seq1:25-255(+)
MAACSQTIVNYSVAVGGAVGCLPITFSVPSGFTTYSSVNHSSSMVEVYGTGGSVVDGGGGGGGGAGVGCLAFLMCT